MLSMSLQGTHGPHRSHEKYFLAINKPKQTLLTSETFPSNTQT